MSRVKTEVISVDGFRFSLDINIDKQGIFTATLPKEISVLFKEAGIDLNKNQLGNNGYFNSTTCRGIITDVINITKEYMSKELVSEKIIIKFCINTLCSYSFDKNKNIVPNCSKEWTGSNDTKWREGNITIDSCHNSPFGFLIYAEPFVRRDYKYKSGKTKIEYIVMRNAGDIADKALEDGYYLRWLKDIPCISMPDGGAKEMDYTEEVAEFFVNTVKAICIMNEKIKDFLNPDGIKLLLKNNGNLLN